MLKEQIEQKLEDMNDWELIQLWNEKANEEYNDEAIIYSMDELDEILGSLSPTEIIQNTCGFNLNREYFHWTVYGLESTDKILDIIDVDELVDYIYENDIRI